MTVAVVPGLLMGICSAGWDQFVEKGWQIALESRLELDSADNSGASNIEDMRHACVDAGVGYARRNLCRYVVHVAMPCRGQGDCLLVRHLRSPCVMLDVSIVIIVQLSIAEFLVF